MSNKSKIASIIGIIIGVAIIVVGIVVLDSAYCNSKSGPAIGRHIEFGADFYTEMYSVTQDVGEAINTNTYAINEIGRILERILRAIGWLIVSLGAIDVCFFGYKLASVCNKTRNKKDESKENTDSTDAATESEAPKDWFCTECGTKNSPEAGFCTECGKKKRNSEN